MGNTWEDIGFVASMLIFFYSTCLFGYLLGFMYLSRPQPRIIHQGPSVKNLLVISMFAVLCNVCLIGCLVGYLLSSHPEWRTVYTPFSPVIMLPFTGFLGCLNCYLVGYGEWSDPQLGVKSRDAFKVSILSVSTGVAAVKAIQYAVEYVRGD